MTSSRPLRVLVVDDSALNRSEIIHCLSTFDDVEVVAEASDGSQALELAPKHRPDVILLDLEMPKLDGFSFLRIAPSLWRCPVVVLSGARTDKQVFRALELGALDFVPKPETSAERMNRLPALLREKLNTVRALSPTALARRTDASGMSRTESLLPVRRGGMPRNVIALAASTGGPTAITQLLLDLNPSLNFAVLIAQHMPDKFTKTFAERLNRLSPLTVREANDGESVESGTVLICPGRQCLELTRTAAGFAAKVSAPVATDRYVPSADRLMTSVARAIRRRAIGVVLTGMGDDGAKGAKEIAGFGGVVVAESARTAVVYGMPGAAVNSGCVRRSLELPKLGGYINDLLRH